jgi:hypothetical protein
VLGCSFCEAMVGLLAVASSAVLLAKVAVVDTGVMGRSAVYSKYNDCPGSQPLGMPAMNGLSSVYSVSTLINYIFCYIDDTGGPSYSPCRVMNFPFSAGGGGSFPSG